MKSEELLSAIGNLDEDMLAECEAPLPRRTGRILWRVAAVAAVFSLMTIAAAAVNNLFLDLGDAPALVEKSDIQWTTFNIDSNGVLGEESGTGAERGIRVFMEIPTNPNAPILLENAYVPTAPDHWVSCGVSHALTDGQLSQFSLSWEPHAGADGVMSSVIGPECSMEDIVQYRQVSAYFYNKHVGGEHSLDVLMTIPDRVEVTSRVVTLGGISMLRVDIPAFSLTTEEYLQATALSLYMSSGETRLYWSDGNSIFSLVCPGWMEDSEIEALLETLHPVEDIQSYLNEIRDEIRIRQENSGK